MTSKFDDMTPSPNFFDVVLFLLLSLVTGPGFMSISSLVLELWQFTSIRDWPEIRKPEIHLCEFCPISGYWGELGIPKLTEMSLIKYNWMLQNAGVTAFTVSALLKENQQGGKITAPAPIAPPRLGLNYNFLLNWFKCFGQKIRQFLCFKCFSTQHWDKFVPAGKIW